MIILSALTIINLAVGLINYWLHVANARIIENGFNNLSNRIDKLRKRVGNLEDEA